MKVAYVTAYDVSNVRKVNGAGRYIADCLLKQGIALEFMNIQHAPFVFLTHGLLKVKEQVHKRFARTAYVATRSKVLAHVYARQLEAQLRHSDAEIVFSPICPGSLPTSYLRTSRPIVFWTDATFAGLLNFYSSYGDLAPQTIRDGLVNERAAIERSSLAIFSSDWAAQTAIKHYGLSPERAPVVPFGPYMPNQPHPTDVPRLIAARPTGICKLLFMGREWHRKGGDRALEIANALRDRGVVVELTIAGSHPPPDVQLPPYVRSLGFLHKAVPEQRQTIERLLAESHFLLIPARADCAPAVVREAGAYGLPCVTSDVGGLDTLVVADRNGRTFPAEAPASTYADYIAEVFRTSTQYRQLALTSFEEYQARLSWASSGRAVKSLLQELLKENVTTGCSRDGAVPSVA